MSTFYVSPSGSDTANGSAATPWQTVSHALDTVAPSGDTIMVNDGLYTPWFNDQTRLWLNITKSVTLRSVNPKGAVLDGALQCHSPINLNTGSANVLIQDFLIKRGAHGGIWANSLAAKGVTVRGCEIAYISNIPDGTQIGNCGIYMDGAAVINVDASYLHDIGRSTAIDPGNAFDHAIYSHGAALITNCTFAALLQGWAIQTSQGFSGRILNNAFNGPVEYAGSGGLKNGQIMFWQAASGGIEVSSNLFNNPRGYALETFAFSFPVGTFKSGNNQVSGGLPLGGPAGQVSSGATGPVGPQTTPTPTPPAPSGVTVTVNGQAVKTALPVTITIQ